MKSTSTVPTTPSHPLPRFRVGEKVIRRSDLVVGLVERPPYPWGDRLYVRWQTAARLGRGCDLHSWVKPSALLPWREGLVQELHARRLAIRMAKLRPGDGVWWRGGGGWEWGFFLGMEEGEGAPVYRVRRYWDRAELRVGAITPDRQRRRGKGA